MEENSKQLIGIVITPAETPQQNDSEYVRLVTQFLNRYFWPIDNIYIYLQKISIER